MAAHASSCDQVADSPWDERPVQREMPWVQLRVFTAHVSAPSNCVSVDVRCRSSSSFGSSSRRPASTTSRRQRHRIGPMFSGAGLARQGNLLMAEKNGDAGYVCDYVMLC